MIRSGWTALAAFLIVMCAVGRSAVQAGSGEGEGLTQIAPGVYARVVDPDGNAVSNSGVVVLESGVLIFDTHFTLEAAQSLQAEIRRLTAKSVRYVINSHHHPDHTHGNAAFDSAAQVISSSAGRLNVLERDIPALNRSRQAAQEQLDRLKKELQAPARPEQQQALTRQIGERQRWVTRMNQLRIVPPIMTVDDTLEIFDPFTELRLLVPGRGHSDGDLVLYLPRERVLFAGDLVFSEALPNTQDAYMLDWIATLGELMKLDVTTVVPGHGPPGGKQAIETFRQYLVDLRQIVEPFVVQGESLEEALRQIRIPEAYESFRFQAFFESNVQKMFGELKEMHAAQNQEPQKKPPQVH